MIRMKVTGKDCNDVLPLNRFEKVLVELRFPVVADIVNKENALFLCGRREREADARDPARVLDYLMPSFDLCRATGKGRRQTVEARTFESKPVGRLLKLNWITESSH